MLYRYCRALDRMDRGRALSCWHAGGTDDHSPNYSGPATGFVDRVWAVRGGFGQTRHVTSNVLIDLAGDRAGVDSYVAILLRARRDDGIVDLFTQGRYLDDFERIDDVWAIRHRRSISEWHRVDRFRDTVADFDPPLVVASVSGGPARRAARDASDPSYAVLLFA